eukprot:3190743-Alexandrium_andersonii.AAC.1
MSASLVGSEMCIRDSTLGDADVKVLAKALYGVLSRHAPHLVDRVQTGLSRGRSILDKAIEILSAAEGR